MKRLCTQASAFEIPKRSPEEWAELNRRAAEHEAAEAERRRAAHLFGSGIPEEYRAARVGGVHGAVAAWAADPAGALMVRGEVGRGKTWAACAALHELAATRTVRFATLRRIADEVRTAEWREDALGRYQRAGALCIDDLGKDQMTPNRLSLLFEVVKWRDEAGLPTIYTTNYPWQQLVARLAAGDDPTLLNTVVSRLSRCRMVEIAGPDRRICNG